MRKPKKTLPEPMLRPEPIVIKAKFSDETLLPGEIVAGRHIAQKYKLAGGEIVTLVWTGVYDNIERGNDKELDKVCRELFGMGFDVVESAWKRRLGDIGGMWHRVRMMLSD